MARNMDLPGAVAKASVNELTATLVDISENSRAKILQALEEADLDQARPSSILACSNLKPFTWTNDIGCGEGSGNGQLKTPFGIAISPGGEFLFVTEYVNNRVSIFNTADGSWLKHIGGTKAPQGLAVSPDGKSLFVAEHGNCRVSVFDTTDGSLVRQMQRWELPEKDVDEDPFAPDLHECRPPWHGIGKKPPKNDELVYPQDVCLSPDGALVFVADGSNGRRICVFGATDGKWLRDIGFGHGSGEGQLDDPCSVALSPDGTLLFVSEAGNGRISVFNASDGTWVRHIGSGKGRGDGQLKGPHVTISPDGASVFATDSCLNRISVFAAEDGSWLGHTAEGARLDDPRGAVLSQDGTLLYVTDCRNHRVCIFRRGI